jgi:hypothetical protein
VQDPAAQTYSAWQTARHKFCHPLSADCVIPDFATTVKRDIAISKQGGCLFDTPVRASPGNHLGTGSYFLLLYLFIAYIAIWNSQDKTHLVVFFYAVVEEAE